MFVSCAIYDEFISGRKENGSFEVLFRLRKQYLNRNFNWIRGEREKAGNLKFSEGLTSKHVALTGNM